MKEIQNKLVQEFKKQYPDKYPEEFYEWCFENVKIIRNGFLIRPIYCADTWDGVILTYLLK